MRILRSIGWLSPLFGTLLRLAPSFFSPALQTVPESLYQAARIDRAPAFKRCLHITLPHLRPTVMFVLVVVTVEAFRSFDLLFAMTRGGPGTASQTFPMLIFRYTFEFSRYGLGGRRKLYPGCDRDDHHLSLLLRPNAPSTIGRNRRRAGGPAIAIRIADRRRNGSGNEKNCRRARSPLGGHPAGNRLDVSCLSLRWYGLR